jgi:clan AA aspartic protease (TIGR02281 family)
MKAILKGLFDNGETGSRLVADQEEREFVRRARGVARRPGDVYHQQTATFRAWRENHQAGGLTTGPRENSAVKVLWALTWFGAIGGAGVAYMARNGISAMDQRNVPEIASKSTVVATPAAPVRIGPVAALLPAPSSSMPTVQAAGATPSAFTPVTAQPMPAVQRPSELSSSTQSPTATAGRNEAVAERGRDGHFQFDAIVNGMHVPMLFDTGASVVALRAEDAARLGISLAKLNYSLKAKTANGSADVAPVIIDTITVGNITLRQVQGFVGRPGALHENLLGQAFLARLAGYNVERNQLVLKGR